MKLIDELIYSILGTIQYSVLLGSYMHRIDLQLIACDSTTIIMLSQQKLLLFLIIYSLYNLRDRAATAPTTQKFRLYRVTVPPAEPEQMSWTYVKTQLQKQFPPPPIQSPSQLNEMKMLYAPAKPKQPTIPMHNPSHQQSVHSPSPQQSNICCTQLNKHFKQQTERIQSTTTTTTTKTRPPTPTTLIPTTMTLTSTLTTTIMTTFSNHQVFQLGFQAQLGFQTLTLNPYNWC